ncbi:MAG: D-lyxose/D-mannose family sugar isomerase [Opitutales bacterium]
MKRSEINRFYHRAKACFEHCGWTLPPNPRWDITDFGLGAFENHGLTLIHLAEEPEYCERLMYAVRGQTTPAHTHRLKKEDIICRNGRLALRLWPLPPDDTPPGEPFIVRINGLETQVRAGEAVELVSGERITLVPGIYHEFYPISDECIVGEVSTANTDTHDYIFVNSRIVRNPEIIEDAAAEVRLLSEQRVTAD